MRMINGIETCTEHGDFDWKITFLSSGDVWSGKWSDYRKNIVSYTEEKDKYIVIVKCPKCDNTFDIELNKEKGK